MGLAALRPASMAVLLDPGQYSPTAVGLYSKVPALPAAGQRVTRGDAATAGYRVYHKYIRVALSVRYPDSGSRQYRPPHLRALVLLGLMWTFGLSAWAAPTDYALIMPGAATSLLLDVAVAGNRLVAVGERGHILYSEDGGSSWLQATVPTSVMLTRVFFVSDSTGWAVGHDGNILLSSDGGLNWVLQRDGISDQAQINEERMARARQRVNELREQIATATPQATDDLGDALDEAQTALESALEAMDEPVYAPPLMDIWFASENQGWAAGAFGTLLRTSNGGRDWEDAGYSLPNPEELHLNGVVGDASGTLYLSSEWGLVYRSSTGGASWEVVESGFEGSFFGVLVNPHSDSVFAYGLLGAVYRSTDRGRSWQQLDSHTRDSLFGAAAADDGRLVFVGQNGTVVTTADDGASLRAAHRESGRGLYGVAFLGRDEWVVTGEGGSTVLSDLFGGGR